MKTKMKIKMKSYLGGLISGLALFGIFSFTQGQGDAIFPLSPDYANQYFNSYMETAQPTNDTLKGLVIDKSQYESMKALYTADTESSLKAMRIYFGKDIEGNSVGMVVGVKEDGKDATGKGIFASSAVKLGTCPSICDANSPITSD